MFSEIIASTSQVNSVLEVGANIGLNLQAISTLRPNCTITGIEINQVAAQKLAQVQGVNALVGSIFDFEPEQLGRHDLTMTCGVLIHINPAMLNDVYERLYRCSNHYICVAEYYNPEPVVIPYRKHTDRLFKRDFAGELLDKYSDLELVDYRFHYRRDKNFPADDITWFLLRKTGVSQQDAKRD